MSEKLLVTTAPKRLVKDPRGRVVPEKFVVDPADPFWRHLLRSGDLVTITEVVDASGAAPANAAPANVAPAKGASVKNSTVNEGES